MHRGGFDLALTSSFSSCIYLTFNIVHLFVFAPSLPITFQTDATRYSGSISTSSTPVQQQRQLFCASVGAHIRLQIGSAPVTATAPNLLFLTHFDNFALPKLLHPRACLFARLTACPQHGSARLVSDDQRAQPGRHRDGGDATPNPLSRRQQQQRRRR